MSEKADLQRRRYAQITGFRRKATGDEFRECRFAIAVGTEQRDAVVGIYAQVQAIENRSAWLVPTEPPSMAMIGEAGCFSGVGKLMGCT